LPGVFSFWTRSTSIQRKARAQSGQATGVIAFAICGIYFNQEWRGNFAFSAEIYFWKARDF
jgi:hypothetical protein